MGCGKCVEYAGRAENTLRIHKVVIYVRLALTGTGICTGIK